MEDDEAREYIIARSKATSVPQIEIGQMIIIGFDREALEEQLVKRGLIRDRRSNPH